jgi:hypothetical protein
MADPRTPAIPFPIADVGSLASGMRAVKLRLDNISAYVTGTSFTTGGTSNTGLSASYTLPVASQTVLGGVKIDGTTITIMDGVISASADAAIVAASATPRMDLGTPAVGTSVKYAREDHIHPTDTTRYAAANPAGYTPQSYVDSRFETALAWAAARSWFVT